MKLREEEVRKRERRLKRMKMESATIRNLQREVDLLKRKFRSWDSRPRQRCLRMRQEGRNSAQGERALARWRKT